MSNINLNTNNINLKPIAINGQLDDVEPELVVKVPEGSSIDIVKCVSDFATGKINVQELLNRLQEADIAYSFVSGCIKFTLSGKNYTFNIIEKNVNTTNSSMVFTKVTSENSYINKLMEDFSKGNMTVKEAVRYLEANNIEYKISSQNNNYVLQFKIASKIYTIVTNIAPNSTNNNDVTTKLYSTAELKNYDTNLVAEYFITVKANDGSTKYKLKEGKTYPDFILACSKKIAKNPGIKASGITVSGSWYSEKQCSKNGTCISTVQNSAINYLKTTLKQAYKKSFDSNLKAILEALGYTSSMQNKLFEAYFAETVYTMSKSINSLTTSGYKGFLNNKGWANIDKNAFVNACTKDFNNKTISLLNEINEYAEKYNKDFGGKNTTKDKNIQEIEKILLEVKEGTKSRKEAEIILLRNYDLTYSEALLNYANSFMDNNYLNIDGRLLEGFNVPSSFYWYEDGFLSGFVCYGEDIVNDNFKYSITDTNKGGKAERDFKKYIEDNNLKEMMEENYLAQYSTLFDVLNVDASEVFNKAFKEVLNSDKLFDCLKFNKSNDYRVLDVVSSVAEFLEQVKYSINGTINNISDNYKEAALDERENVDEIDTTLVFDLSNVDNNDIQKELKARGARVGDIVTICDSRFVISSVDPRYGDYVLEEIRDVNSTNDASQVNDNNTVLSMSQEEYEKFLKDSIAIVGADKPSILEDEQEVSKFLNRLRNSTKVFSIEAIMEEYYAYIGKNQFSATIADHVTAVILATTIAQMFTGTDNERTNQDFLKNNKKSFRQLFAEFDLGLNNNDQYGIRLQGNYGWTGDRGAAFVCGALDAFAAGCSMIPGVGTVASIAISIFTDLLEVGVGYFITGEADWTNFVECAIIDAIFGAIPGAKMFQGYIKGVISEYVKEGLAWFLNQWVSNMNFKGPQEIGNRNGDAAGGNTGRDLDDLMIQIDNTYVDFPTFKKIYTAIITTGDLSDPYMNDDGSKNHDVD